MKKITFRRCTVMAAVFAACLFAAGCKPNQPNPAPNPEPAPNPAPSPAPNPAPAPSIEVPMPDTPSVVPGGTVQEQTIPNPYPPAVETVNVPLVLRSVERPTAAGEYYGVAPRYEALAAGVKILISIPKSIKDKPAERNAALEKQLIAKLKAEYDAEYKLYGSANKTTTPVPSFTDNSNVFVGQSETTMTVKTAVVLKTLTAANGSSPATSYKTKFPSLEKNVVIMTSNTELDATIAGKIEGRVKALLDYEIGANKYEVWKEAGGTNAFATGDYPADTTTVTNIFVGKKLVHITKSFTVKSIHNTIAGPVNPILGEPWTIATTSGTGTTFDNLTIASNPSDVEGKLKSKMDALRGTTTGAYKFYADAAGTIPLKGEHLETLDVIYAGL